MRAKLASLVILVLLTASCSSGGAGSQSGSGRSAARTSVAVLVPFHPVSQEGSAYDAGRVVATRIARVLEPKVAAVDLIEAHNEAEAMRMARRSGAEVMFVPSIGEWEDHDSRWAATQSDVLNVEIVVREVATGDVLHSVTYKAQGRQQYLRGNPAIEEMLSEKFERTVLGLLRY
ncbi:MAG TPA: DUF4823 domain-containing protein [Candidatus Binatia bacterium]|nr:DUF4823 domain-containing protein [Candidatus Binatia bacterium]